MLLAYLPSWTWDVQPALAKPEKGIVAALIAAFGVISLLYGLKRKVNDQVTTGVIFLVMAGLVYQFLPDHVELRWYSLLFVVVFLGGHALLNWQIKRGGGEPDAASDFIVYGVVGVLAGARLGHVLFYDFDKFLQDPIWLFKIWTGGLASHGAVLGLILAMYLFTKRRGVPFLEGADRFAFSAALGATLVRVGNLMNSEIVGRKTDGSWGMRFPRFDGPDAPLRYPSQLFEIALGIAVFIGLYIADRAMGREKRPRGALISWFFALYFTGRLFTEFFKEYEAIDPSSPLTMGQYLSIPGALLGWYGIYWSYKRRLPAGWYADDDLDRDEADEDEDEDEAADDDAPRDASSRDADESDETEEPIADSAKPRNLDPDVEDEFEGGKLKKQPRE